MQFLHSIPLLCIFLAMLTGFLTAVLRRSGLARQLTVISTALIALSSTMLVGYLAADTGHATVFSLGHFPAPWGNELRAGPMEALFAAVYSLVFLLCVKDSRAHSLAEIKPMQQSFYYSVLNLLLGALLTLIYTNDLFTAYVFLEVSTIGACAIIMIGGKRESLVETMRYFIMYLIGSAFFLLGVVLLYSVTGQLLMEPLGAAVSVLAAQGNYAVTLVTALGLLALGLAVKSAVFPFHSILPGAHGSAVTTSSAILSGLLLETYIILLIKLLYRVATIQVALSVHLLDFFLVLGLAAMVVGSLCALREHDIKRMLAYSSAAQVGYIYVGIGLGSDAGMVAACFHIIAHAVTKSMLFLSAGELSLVSNHSKSFVKLRSAAWRAPLAGVGFTLGAVSLIGVPLLACFVSKLYLAQSAMDGTWRMVFVLAALGLSMILNACYLLPAVLVIWSRRAAEPDYASCRLPKLTRRTVKETLGSAIFLLMLANVLLGIWHGPVIQCLQSGVKLLS